MSDVLADSPHENALTSSSCRIDRYLKSEVDGVQKGIGDSMTKRIFNTAKITRSYWPATAHATRAGDFVFVTGQVANPPGSNPRDRKEMEFGTLEAQTIRVMENIKAILEEAGTSLENVVKRNVYLTHSGDFQPVYSILERYFKSPVASTGVITGLVPASARVEVDVIAYVPR